MRSKDRYRTRSHYDRYPIYGKDSSSPDNFRSKSSSVTSQNILHQPSASTERMYKSEKNLDTLPG